MKKIDVALIVMVVILGVLSALTLYNGLKMYDKTEKLNSGIYSLEEGKEIITWYVLVGIFGCSAFICYTFLVILVIFRVTPLQHNSQVMEK